jgi:starch-binding outer membrane protein, SusD/RagB family
MKTQTASMFIATILLIVTGACSDFLEQEPQSVLHSKTFFTTEENAIMAVNGIYDKLNKRYTSNRSLWVMHDVSTPDTETLSAEAPISIIDNFTFGTTSEDIDNLWNECYEAIARANLAIAYVPNVPMNATTRQRLVGEARFLRAWFYFVLVTTYGEVPLVTAPIDPSDKNALMQSKATFTELYDAIELDLSFAEIVLPWAYDGGDIGRATKGAAKAYLAKAYLFREKWLEAAAKASEVIEQSETNGTYQLLESFREATWAKNSKESIFEMQSLGGTSGIEDQNEGNSITAWHRPTCIGGWGLHFGTKDLADAFEAGDPRKGYTLLASGEYYNGKQLPEGCLPPDRYALLKLMGDPSLGDGTDANAAQNFCFMRLAEVYLMKAEAEAENGNLQAAEEALEKVRSRARNDALAEPGSLPALFGLDQQSLIQAVRHERRVELASEMKRFPDLRRWGILAEVNQADGKPFVAGKHEYFPIPQSQIDLSEGNLKQNDGY